MTTNNVEVIDPSKWVIKDTRKVWTVTPNLDKTEGRGPLYTKAVCLQESTAIRLAARACVQGSDALVLPATAVRFTDFRYWYAPTHIRQPTAQDKLRENELEKKRKARKRLEDTLTKAKLAGLSDEDIAILKGAL